MRAGNWQRVVYTVDKNKCLHEQSVRVTKRMLTRARRDNMVWGQAMRPPPAICTERHVISAETFEHLQKWIFSTELLETLKATEQSTQRGHCFATKEALSTTWPRCVLSVREPKPHTQPFSHTRYTKDAESKGVEPVAERVYRRSLTQKCFTKYRKDHCMCTTCLRAGWRGNTPPQPQAPKL